MKNPFRLVRAFGSAINLVRDPGRLDEVFELADVLQDPAILREIAKGVAEDPQGARALVERPRVGKLDLDELRRLPDGSLGRAFAEHMIGAGLDPAALPFLAADDPEKFLLAHLYETHDIWHVVTGFGTDVAGELGLQAFYLAQVPGRLASLLLAGGFLNTLFFRFDERNTRMHQIVRGWLLGRRARKLFGIAWATMWSAPLADVQKQLGIDITGVEDVLPAAA